MVDMETGISLDAQAILLICSSVGSRGSDPSLKPFGPRTWAKLEAAVLRTTGEGPSRLLGLSADDMNRLLGLGREESQRIERLLARSGQLAFEVDRLRSRGLWAITLADETYPTRLRDRLNTDAPPVLFGAGDRSMLERGGVAIVGSRDADAAAVDFTVRLAQGAVASGAQVVSGGARGVDAWAMRTAFEREGSVIGVLPEGVERRLREPENRSAIAADRAVLVSPYRPDASFSAGTAMARNKLIYALSDVAVVVSSAKETGGTWTGAIEALDAGWVPILVRDGEVVPDGNRELIRRGFAPLTAESLEGQIDIEALRALAGPTSEKPPERPDDFIQPSLFND